MRHDIEVKFDSVIVGRINAARMSELERQIALNAMRDADLLVNAFIWVAKKIEQLFGRLFLKPALRH